jgi:hypothetical protein
MEIRVTGKIRLSRKPSEILSDGVHLVDCPLVDTIYMAINTTIKVYTFEVHMDENGMLNVCDEWETYICKPENIYIQRGIRFENGNVNGLSGSAKFGYSLRFEVGQLSNTN